MFKSKSLLMLITGIGLALIILGIIQFAQKGFVNSETETVNDSANVPVTDPIAAQYANAPASILSAAQTEFEFSLTGTGVPGAGLSLQNDAREIARTKVSGDGEWALNFSANATSSSLALDLLMLTPDGHQIRSDQSLFIVKALDTPKQEGGVSTSSKALLLLTAPGAHSRVLQSPYSSLPQKNGFMLEAIDYDNSGGVIFSGSSEKQGKVRIYAGGNLVGESHVDNQGRWSLIFGNIMPLGEYKIIAELIVPEGETVMLTLPFSRMRPMFEAENSPKILVEHLDDRIQIGRALFGGGYQYSVIYAPEALEE